MTALSFINFGMNFEPKYLFHSDLIFKDADRKQA